jgi:Na+/melibiose symporter-like transporter
VVGTRGPRLPLVVAGVAIMASGLWLTRLTPATSDGSLLVSYLLFGLGFGVVNTPITNTAMAGMPTEQAGVAAAVASTSRQIGQSVGVAVIGSAVVSALTGPLRAGFTSASHIGWWLVAGLGLVVLGLGLLTTGQWARRTAERVAAEFQPVPTESELAASESPDRERAASESAASESASRGQAALDAAAWPGQRPARSAADRPGR